jgi:hypothetical protein
LLRKLMLQMFAPHAEKARMQFCGLQRVHPTQRRQMGAYICVTVALHDARLH